MPKRRKTAGEMSLKAAADKSIYDPLEVAQGLCDEVMSNLYTCAQRHEAIFDEEEYFVCLIIAADPLIAGIRRHKFAAFLYLPSPRPEQVCFLYSKKTQTLKRLWSLPNAKVMAALSEATSVRLAWQPTKLWCDAFFNLRFWEVIRLQYGFKHLSESEYLNAHREELIKAGAYDGNAGSPEPFDFSKVSIDKIIDTKTAVSEK